MGLMLFLDPMPGKGLDQHQGAVLRQDCLLPLCAGILRSKITVRDGHFPEGKEVVGGYATYEVAFKEEAIMWSLAFHGIAGRALSRLDGESEIRQVMTVPNQPLSR